METIPKSSYYCAGISLTAAVTAVFGHDGDGSGILSLVALIGIMFFGCVCMGSLGMHALRKCGMVPP